MGLLGSVLTSKQAWMNHWRHTDIHCRLLKKSFLTWTKAHGSPRLTWQMHTCIWKSMRTQRNWCLSKHTGGCTSTRDYPLESSAHLAFFKRLWMACTQVYKVVQLTWTTSSWLTQHWKSTIGMSMPFSRGSQSVDFESEWRSVRSRKRRSSFWGIWLARMDVDQTQRKSTRSLKCRSQGQEAVKVLLGHDMFLFVFCSRDAIHERTFGRPGEER